ncbi:MAG TPA: hypothetical protein VJ483_06835, partial [Holophagaceae bacterium]|nr:hypothetical protein [Holophagaceae bacterium]
CPSAGLPCADAAVFASHTPTAASLTEQGAGGSGTPVYALLLGNDFTKAAAPAGVRYTSTFQTAPSTSAAMDATAPVFSADGSLEGSRIGAALVLFGKDGAIPGSFAYSTGTATTAIHHVIVDLAPGTSYTVGVSNGSGGQTLTSSAAGVLEFSTTPASGTSQAITITKH